VCDARNTRIVLSKPEKARHGGNSVIIQRGLTMIRIRIVRACLALLPAVVLAACVSQSKYDALLTQDEANQQRIASLTEQNNRLQNAIRYTVNSDLLFASGSWQLSENGAQVMSRIASQLAPNQTRHIVINGYTDDAPIGPALQKQGVESNVDLSQRRAQSVIQFLGTHGVRQEFMTAKGWGEANPVAPNTSPAGRAQNRRVDITFADATSS